MLPASSFRSKHRTPLPSLPGSSVLVVAVEELVNLRLIHAGEAAGRQRGQEVGVGPRRRPGHAGPAPGEPAGRPLAAVAVRAAGYPADGRIAAAEPPGVLVGDPERDREAPLPAGVDVGHAPVR